MLVTADLSYLLHQRSAGSWVRKKLEQEAAIFRQMRLRLLISLILALTSPEMEISSLKFRIFGKQFSLRQKIVRQAKFRARQLTSATTPLSKSVVLFFPLLVYSTITLHCSLSFNMQLAYQVYRMEEKRRRTKKKCVKPISSITSQSRKSKKCL